MSWPHFKPYLDIELPYKIGQPWQHYAKGRIWKHLYSLCYGTYLRRLLLSMAISMCRFWNPYFVSHSKINKHLRFELKRAIPLVHVNDNIEPVSPWITFMAIPDIWHRLSLERVLTKARRVNYSRRCIILAIKESVYCTVLLRGLKNTLNRHF